jgi:hypothetical protein
VVSSEREMKILNIAGLEYLERFLSRVVEDYDDHDPQAWASHAEAVQMNTPTGDDIIIEVRQSESISGRPETLTIPAKYFANL